MLFVYKEKQQIIDQKVSEIDKLNSIINVVEKDMIRLKKQYEQVQSMYVCMYVCMCVCGRKGHDSLEETI